jgi:hypothetical protein
MAKVVDKRDFCELSEVRAREGYNTKTGKNTGKVSSLVSRRGNPVTALYDVKDFGKRVADATVIAYLETFFKEGSEPSDK